MTLRNRLISASLAAAAFVVTPSPVTQGQANSINHAFHVDQAVLLDASLDVGDLVDLRAMDARAIAEVERLAASAR